LFFQYQYLSRFRLVWFGENVVYLSGKKVAGRRYLQKKFRFGDGKDEAEKSVVGEEGDCVLYQRFKWQRFVIVAGGVALAVRRLEGVGKKRRIGNNQVKKKQISNCFRIAEVTANHLYSVVPDAFLRIFRRFRRRKWVYLNADDG